MDAAWLTEPLEHEFMRRALTGVCLAGVNCAALGAYVVLRRMASISGALTHTILPGVVFAVLNGFSLYWGAMGAAVATALAVGGIVNRRHIREDTATGVILSFMFALGILLMTRAQSFRDFTALLFGNVLSVSGQDIAVITGVTVATILFLSAFHKELELSSYDEDYAALAGTRPALLRHLLLVLVALGTVACVRLVGALLTTALLVTPAAAGVLLARSVFGVMLWGAGIAVFSGVTGLYLSYHLDKVPSGAAIVLVCSGCFFVAWIYRGLADRRRPRAFDED
jgi:ABC-type Mn2+/Zn2+ transport system permease subunit